jgi:hypothetical protein
LIIEFRKCCVFLKIKYINIQYYIQYHYT